MAECTDPTCLGGSDRFCTGDHKQKEPQQEPKKEKR